MNSRHRLSTPLFFITLIGTGVSAPAGSRITFDTTVISTPFVIIEDAKEVKADFTFSNTGDTDLKITGITSGCTCVSVHFDTTTAPGAEGHVAATVSIRAFNSGKTMTVLSVASNAENSPSVNLAVKTSVRSVVDMTEPYITLNANRGDTRKTIGFSSKKRDLAVTQVVFEPQAQPGAENWQTAQPVPVKFYWTPVDSTDSMGYRQFDCTLFMPQFETSQLGRFIFTMNHPKKKKAVVPGTLLR